MRRGPRGADDPYRPTRAWNEDPRAHTHHRNGAARREVSSICPGALPLGTSVGGVVVAWLQGLDQPVIPLAGAGSVAQLEEALEADDLKLTEDQRARLDAAR